MYYDDIEYASRRLVNTLVRKKNGNPFLIISVSKGEDGNTYCAGQDTLRELVEEINLRDIDLTPVPLGFANIGGKMSYLCRKPMRKDWRQGLSLNSLVSYGVNTRDLRLNYLTNTILNKYPTVQKCIEYVKTGSGYSMAFSRDFGIINKGKEIELIYRKYSVGKLVGQTFVLDPDKFFLEQHLSESMG